VEPCDYAVVPGGIPSASLIDPATRAGNVRRVIEAAGDGLRLAGASSNQTGVVGFANSRGAEGYHTHSDVDVHTTAVTDSSSGWAGEVSPDPADVDPGRLGALAGERARIAKDPVTIEPGEYPVVLSPTAACEMMAFLLFSADAKAADEGRSALAGKEGERIASEKVTIRSILAEPACPGSPFNGEGAPARDVTWIDRGTLTTLHNSRYWAAKTDRPFTPWPGTISMEGTNLSTEDLIGKIDRGLYITRFWYTRFVDPMTLLLTGMTRDALFLIENGRIVSGCRHLRYNDSPLRILGNVTETGRPEPARMYMRGMVPPLLVSGFRFTSGTTF